MSKHRHVAPLLAVLAFALAVVTTTNVNAEPRHDGPLTTNDYIEGTRYHAGTELTFFPNGKLNSALLSTDTAIRGFKFSEGSSVWFHENGKIRAGVLVAHVTIQGMRVGPRCEVEFHDNGMLRKVLVLATTKVQGFTFPPRTTLEFGKSGRLASADLSESTEIRGVIYKAWSRVNFGNDGSVRNGYLAADSVIQGITFRSGDYIAYHLKGGVFLGVLAEPATIGGVEFRTGEHIAIQDDGAVQDLSEVYDLISEAASLLTDQAEWTDRARAHVLYDRVLKNDGELVTECLVQQIQKGRLERRHVLFLAVKMGISGSERRLNHVLADHGDKSLAEDFLNSGSPELYEGGRDWARRNGYSIGDGSGSHRTSWGRF